MMTTQPRGCGLQAPECTRTSAVRAKEVVMRAWILAGVLPLLLVPTPAHGQDCYVGVYADPQGTISLLTTRELTPFKLYVVARLEDDVQSFSYRLSGSQLGVSLFLTGSCWGPQCLGSHLPSPDGETIDLGECVSGQGGEAVVVARYSALTSADFVFDELCAEPYSEVNPDHVVYESCDGTWHSCETGPCLYLTLEEVPSGATSWGAVKSLYR
jgi:hypothetical protein